MGVSGPEFIRRKLIAEIKPWFESDFSMLVEFYVIKRLDGNYPEKQINVSKQQISHLLLADENFDIPAPINALVGAEVYAEMIRPDLYKHNDGAMMQLTGFGHIILGRFMIKKNINDSTAFSLMQAEQIKCINLNHEEINKNQNELLQTALSNFWKIEEINKLEDKTVLSTEQTLVEENFLKTHYREPSGRYVVTIPINPRCNALGDSRAMAAKQFKQLELRFR